MVRALIGFAREGSLASSDEAISACRYAKNFLIARSFFGSNAGESRRPLFFISRFTLSTRSLVCRSSRLRVVCESSPERPVFIDYSLCVPSYRLLGSDGPTLMHSHTTREVLVQKEPHFRVPSIGFDSLRPQCPHSTIMLPAIGGGYLNLFESALPQRLHRLVRLKRFSISSNGAASENS